MYQGLDDEFYAEQRMDWTFFFFLFKEIQDTMQAVPGGMAHNRFKFWVKIY